MTTDNSKQKENQFDVAIIGAGPIGLFAAFQAQLCGLSCTVIDALDKPGGQCTELYPDKPIFDIPAISECSASDLISRLQEQIAPFDIPFHFKQAITAISRTKSSSVVNNARDNFNDDVNNVPFQWTLHSSSGKTIEANYVIIATGGGKYSPQRLNLAYAEQLEDKHIHYAVKERTFFRHKKIVIAGGGDSALDWALTLADEADVTVIHRRKKFSAHPATVSAFLNACEAKRIKFHIATIGELRVNENNQLTSIVINEIDSQKTLAVDHLLPLFGLIAEPCPITIENAVLEHHQSLLTVDPFHYQTSVSDIYACGDIVWYENKQKLILSGFHEAALAMRSILAKISEKQPGKTARIGHSSNNLRLLDSHKNK